MRFVLSRLGSLRGVGRLDPRRVGAFGHSNGGATAAHAMVPDRRIRAGVEPRRQRSTGPVVQRGLDRPFGVMLGDEFGGRLPDRDRDSARTCAARARSCTSPDARHHSFTDFVWVVPQLGPTRSTPRSGRSTRPRW